MVVERVEGEGTEEGKGGGRWIGRRMEGEKGELENKSK